MHQCIVLYIYLVQQLLVIIQDLPTIFTSRNFANYDNLQESLFLSYNDAGDSAKDSTCYWSELGNWLHTWGSRKHDMVSRGEYKIFFPCTFLSRLNHPGSRFSKLFQTYLLKRRFSVTFCAFFAHSFRRILPIYEVYYNNS